jgi:hypothetical protein
MQKATMVRCAGLLFMVITMSTGLLQAQSDTTKYTNTNQSDSIHPDIQKYGQPIDTTIIETAKKIFIFVEYEESLTIDRISLETGEQKRILDIGCEDCETNKEDTLKFRGHWSGIEYGLNDFVTPGYSFQRPDGYGYLDLNNWRSWKFTLNFAQNTTPIIDNHLALVSGLGTELNIYHFQNDNSIQTNAETGEIEERVLTDEYNVRKSKFNTIYLTAPLLLEAQFGKSENSKERFYINGGVIGGLRIAQAVKVVHGVDGKRNKLIERGKDLNLHRWRWGLTARMGYKDIMNIYATYYITPLFENDPGHELHPVSMGFRINF